MLPLGGAALMVALLIGQILEQTMRPYTWFPWVIVIWVALLAAAGALLAGRATAGRGAVSPAREASLLATRSAV